MVTEASSLIPDHWSMFSHISDHGRSVKGNSVMIECFAVLAWLLHVSKGQLLSDFSMLYNSYQYICVIDSKHCKSS